MNQESRNLRPEYEEILKEYVRLHQRSEIRILESGVAMYQMCATGRFELRELDPQPKLDPAQEQANDPDLTNPTIREAFEAGIALGVKLGRMNPLENKG